MKKSIMDWDLFSKVWSNQRHLTVPEDQIRLAMFTFVDHLNETSEDFVLTGNHLLWIYLNTPRYTDELALRTVFLDSNARVKQFLEKTCKALEKSKFSISEFRDIPQGGSHGLFAEAKFLWNDKTERSFNLSVVFGVPMHFAEIDSPIGSQKKIRVASAENLMSELIEMVCRFSDSWVDLSPFDDLWRISNSGLELDVYLLKKLILDRNIESRFDHRLLNPDMEKKWTQYSKRYPDLPQSFQQLILDIGVWLKHLGLDLHLQEDLFPKQHQRSTKRRERRS